MPHLRLPSLILTPNALAWLSHTRQARILNLSRSACNLINVRGEIISLVTRKIGAGPFTIVLDADYFDFTEHLAPASTIRFCTGRLLLGDLEVGLCAARLWSPRPDWARLRQRLSQHPDLPNSLAALTNWLQPRAPSGSLLELLPLLPPGEGGRGEEGETNFLKTTLLLTTRKPASLLCAAIAAADLQACAEAAAALAGLGTGLTPSGDDFLLGASFATRLFLPLGQVEPVLHAIAGAASPRTTPLSAAFLSAAARGESGAPWHALLENLASGVGFAVRIAAGRILRAGHTSGADTLAGFLAVSGRFTFQWSA